MTMPIPQKPTMTPTEEVIFLDGNSYFASVLQDITQAQTHIDVETYIFKNDMLGQRIQQALMAAAERGVHVRILVDGAGTPGWGNMYTHKFKNSHMEVRIFHPFLWRFWQWRNSIHKLPRFFNMLFFFLKFNSRNHRKTFLIDKKIIYVGSANIDICHMSAQQGGKNWRDTSIKLVGVNTDDLQDAFELSWNHTPPQERFQQLFARVNTKTLIRLNNTRHRRRVLYKNLLRRISTCKQRIWITNAYFVPDNFLLKKLTDLAKTGIDVRIVLPRKTDIFIMTWAAAAFYQRLLKAGVRIFEYLPSMLHAKSLILDDWFIVGSSNLNHRSLLHDLEVDVNVQSPSSKQQLEHQFLIDLGNSREITWETWQKRSFLQRFFGRFVLYLKYWI